MQRYQKPLVSETARRYVFTRSPVRSLNALRRALGESGFLMISGHLSQAPTPDGPDSYHWILGLHMVLTSPLLTSCEVNHSTMFLIC